MDPVLVPATIAVLNGNFPQLVAVGGSTPPPPDSPLKVWDGTTWQPAGVKIET